MEPLGKNIWNYNKVMVLHLGRSGGSVAGAARQHGGNRARSLQGISVVS
jgi:hypothetical protein